MSTKLVAQLTGIGLQNRYGTIEVKSIMFSHRFTRFSLTPGKIERGVTITHCVRSDEKRSKRFRAEAKCRSIQFISLSYLFLNRVKVGIFRDSPLLLHSGNSAFELNLFGLCCFSYTYQMINSFETIQTTPKANISQTSM